MTFAVLVVLAPILHSLANNVANLQSPVAELLAGPVLGAAMTGLVILGLLLATRKRAPATLVAVVFLSSVAWLNGNFFVGDFGFLRGAEPDWQKHRPAGWLQLLLLVALAGLMWWQRDVIRRQAVFINAILLATGLAFLHPVVAELQRERPARGFVFTEDGIFGFSADRNVILFVLDTLQADVVHEALQSEPDLAKAFPGFTFFRNAVADFSKTYSSIPALLTAQRFDNSRPLHRFMQQAYLGHSLPGVLKSEGFDVRHHAFSPQALKPHPEVSDNVGDAEGMSAAFVRQRETRLLVDLAWFRLTPHLLKPQVFNDGEFLLGPPDKDETLSTPDCQLAAEQRLFSEARATFDAEFFDEFLHCSRVTLDAPAFRFFHLGGVHAPLFYDRDYGYVGAQPLNRTAFLEQTVGLLSVMGRVLDRLRELGVYDRSTILILGDHGAGELPVGLNLDQPELPPRPAGEGSPVGEQLVMGGLPAVLVKPAAAPGPLVTSDAPVLLSDVPSTVLADLSLDGSAFDGQDMFRLSEGAARTRLHRFYVFSGWNVDYILPMTEFGVRGFSWYPESWHFIRELNEPGGLHGLMVTLFRNGNSDRYGAQGWGDSDSLGSVIEGGEASLRLARVSDGTQLLRVVHYPVHAAAVAENWSVYLGERLLGQFRFLPGNRQRVKQLLIGAADAERLDSEPLRLVSDRTRSAVRVRELRIDSLDAHRYRVGQVIDFGTTGESERFRTYGWDRTEARATATLGEASGVVLWLDQPGPGSWLLELEFSAYAYRQSLPSSFRLQVNSRDLGEVLIDDPFLNRRSVVIPAGVVGRDSMLDLRLEFDPPLAIGMRSLRLTRAQDPGGGAPERQR